MQRVRRVVAGYDTAGVIGHGVTAAVLDTGIAAHPDLNGRVLCFRDFVNRRNSAYDDSGHGTHVCGVLCGDGALSAGKYRGIAPGANLVVGKVLDEKGDGITEHMLEGMDWVLQIKNRYRIRILNISVGIGSLDRPQMEKALADKVDQLWEEGILVVCAAGNKGPLDGTVSAVGGRAVTVGCHDGEYFKDSPGRCELYSGRGIPGSPIRKPDLVAPGTEIISCNGSFSRMRGRVRNAYIAKSGTSMATPIVSGAAALAFEKMPALNNEECKQRLQFSAADLGLPWHQQGYGMLNIARLLS